MKSLIRLWRYIKPNLAIYNIFNCIIHLLEKIIFWFFAIFWLFAIFFILYNLQFEFMMLYEHEEDFDKYIKIIKGAKDTIKNAILNVSSNSNGLSNNINGVTNPDVDNSDINAAIEYLIANTNFTFNDIIAVSESVGSLELGVSILTAGGIVGGVVITPGFNISDLQNEDDNNNNSNNNSNNNEVNNNNNSNNEVNNNNNNSNNEVNNNNNSNNNDINNNNSSNDNSNNNDGSFSANSNNNDGSFSANSIIEEGDSIDSVINIIFFNLFIFFCIFLLFILLIYLYKNRKAILLFITRIYLILFSSIFLYIVYNLSEYIGLISII